MEIKCSIYLQVYKHTTCEHRQKNYTTSYMYIRKSLQVFIKMVLKSFSTRNTRENSYYMFNIPRTEYVSLEFY